MAQTSTCLTFVCLVAGLMCLEMLVSQVSADQKIKIDQLVRDVNYIDGSIGNTLPKEAWWQSKCMQPISVPLCDKFPGYHYTYDIDTRACHAQVGVPCVKGLKQDNMFDKLHNCQQACEKTATEPTCKLLPDPGYKSAHPRCRDTDYRWFHSNGECYQFLYTGCGGNMNNFDSHESCMHFCSGKGEVPKGPGLVPMETKQSDKTTAKPTTTKKPSGDIIPDYMQTGPVKRTRLPTKKQPKGKDSKKTTKKPKTTKNPKEQPKPADAMTTKKPEEQPIPPADAKTTKLPGFP